jgi:hypothetical protein
MVGKLSKTQREVLIALRDGARIDRWLGTRDIFHYLVSPTGHSRVRYSTWNMLHKRGYIEIVSETWSSSYWKISDAGLAALEADEATA